MVVGEGDHGCRWPWAGPLAGRDGRSSGKSMIVAGSAIFVDRSWHQVSRKTGRTHNNADKQVSIQLCFLSWLSTTHPCTCSASPPVAAHTLLNNLPRLLCNLLLDLLLYLNGMTGTFFPPWNQVGLIFGKSDQPFYWDPRISNRGPQKKLKEK